MRTDFNLADVPVVEACDLGFVIEMLVDSGQGLALLRGMTEPEIRDLEDRIWSEFRGSSDARLAIALRFRALIGVFASRRLKALFLERGLRILWIAAELAASHPLNVRFGFNSQRMLVSLADITAEPVDRIDDVPMRIAA